MAARPDLDTLESLSGEPSTAAAWAFQAQNFAEQASLLMDNHLSARMSDLNEAEQKLIAADGEFARRLNEMEEGYDSDHNDEIDKLEAYNTCWNAQQMEQSFITWERRLERLRQAELEYQRVSRDCGGIVRNMKVQCGICFEGVPRTEPALTPDGCEHTYCKGCASSFVLMTVGHVPCKCPERGCEGVISLNLILPYVSPSEGVALQSKMLEKQLVDSGMGLFCPNRACGNLLDLTGIDELEAECPACMQRVCTDCMTRWHVGMTCATYQALPEGERAKEDLELYRLSTEKGWRRCPRCRVMTELAHGCNHITCRCGGEWCYQCGATWDKEQQKCTRLARDGTPCELWEERRLLASQEARHERIVENLVMHAVQVRVNQQDRDINLMEHYNDRNLRARLAGWLRECCASATCVYCDRQFNALEDLEKHLKNTRRHEVFSCCGKIFKTDMSLTAHREAVH
ncbi:hypothetical protein DFJ77DRAFT_452424 [Powellomyces hirtus]|nr:hypothetical protein DFJ77DRAFT_452424 [Powellomyces hirtus]